MIIKTRSFPRAGLIGNPSDGYFGKTIAFTFENFSADITLYQTPELEILPNTRDRSCFRDIGHLVKDVEDFGYYGGIRLLKAAIKKFHEYCTSNRIQLDGRNFTIRYSTNIPQRVGLAGSSAIITACMRALMAFYQVTIPRTSLAGLVLAVENEELNISAGLQDRVAQAYQGLVYMDFSRSLMEKQGYGAYEMLDASLLPPLYIAYYTGETEGSEVFHNDMRARFNKGDKTISRAVSYWAGLTVKFRECLRKGGAVRMAELINANFDKRREVSQISQANLRMVEAARSVGASAKFSGSGGAIVGTYSGEKMYRALGKALAPLHVKLIKPVISGIGRSCSND